MQYRTWKTYYCKFLVLAGYLRSFYQFLFVNFGFGSLSFPFNCHLKQYSNLAFSSGLHTCYIHIYCNSLNPWIHLAKERSLNCQMCFFLKDFGGGCGPKVCSKTTLDMRILSIVSDTSLKFNMEPENQPLEKKIPFGNHPFQVPC